MGGLILIISNYIKIFMHSIGVEPTSLTLLEWAFTINITGADRIIRGLRYDFVKFLYIPRPLCIHHLRLLIHSGQLYYNYKPLSYLKYELENKIEN